MADAAQIDAAARLQPGHVTAAPARGLAQDRYCIGLADELLEALARAVPVDQEHDARADAFQRGLDGGIIGAVELRGTHRVGRTLVEFCVRARLQP